MKDRTFAHTKFLLSRLEKGDTLQDDDVQFLEDIEQEIIDLMVMINQIKVMEFNYGKNL
jgi:hypothetical protein